MKPTAHCRNDFKRGRGTPVLVATWLGIAGSSVAAATLDIAVRDASDRPAGGVVVLIDTPAPAATPATRPPVEIKQLKLRFSPTTTVAAAGSTVVFANEDEFDHHVHGVSDKRNFELLIPAAEPESRKPSERRPTESVKLTEPGVVKLSCHLHGSMQGHIYVTQAPFFGVTDASGNLRIEGVPAGKVTVRTWHPFELVAPVSTQVTVVEPAIAMPLRLNFALPSRQR